MRYVLLRLADGQASTDLAYNDDPKRLEWLMGQLAKVMQGTYSYELHDQTVSVGDECRIIHERGPRLVSS